MYYANAPINHSIESRGYVNAGTQQLLKPLTLGVRGFHFVCFTHRKGRFCFVRQKDALKVSAGYVTICM